MGIQHPSPRGWILIEYLLMLIKIEEKDGIKTYHPFAFFTLYYYHPGF